MIRTYEELLSHQRIGHRAEYDEDRAIFYALAVGVGSPPTDRSQLAFVYEKGLKVLPSFVTVAVWDDSFDQFQTIKRHIIDGGFDYRIIMLPGDAPLGVGGGISYTQ